jgi:hypothetical protein
LHGPRSEESDGEEVVRLILDIIVGYSGGKKMWKERQNEMQIT